MLFDRARLRRRAELSRAEFLHRAAQRELIERLGLVRRTFRTALVVGPSSPALDAAWQEALPHALCVDRRPRPGLAAVADIQMPFRRAVALAVSMNDLHLCDDPVAALAEMRGTLVPDGLFLGVVAASGTLDELADVLLAADADVSGGAAMRVAPFGDVRRWGDALARAGFALPVVDEMRLTVRYGTLRGLYADLSAMGVRGVLAERAPGSRALFQRAEALYRERHGDPDGRLRATFALAFLSGWAPDPSQQKPARRGSATVSLADALKAER